METRVDKRIHHSMILDIIPLTRVKTREVMLNESWCNCSVSWEGCVNGQWLGLRIKRYSEWKVETLDSRSIFRFCEKCHNRPCQLLVRPVQLLYAYFKMIAWTTIVRTEATIWKKPVRKILCLFRRWSIILLLVMSYEREILRSESQGRKMLSCFIIK